MGDGFFTAFTGIGWWLIVATIPPLLYLALKSVWGPNGPEVPEEEQK